MIVRSIKRLLGHWSPKKNGGRHATGRGKIGIVTRLLEWVYPAPKGIEDALRDCAEEWHGRPCVFECGRESRPPLPFCDECSSAEVES